MPVVDVANIKGLDKESSGKIIFFAVDVYLHRKYINTNKEI